MSMLARVSSERRPRPPRTVIFGGHKLGKSTFAASAPNCIMLEIEDGLDDLEGVASTGKLECFEDVMQTLSELVTEQHPYQHVGVDSLDWFEPMVINYTCRQNGWLDANGNNALPDNDYGKSAVKIRENWRDYLDLVDQLRNRNIGVIQIAHATTRTIKTPDVEPYDHVTLKLNDKVGSLILEAAEIIGYAHAPIVVQEEKVKGGGFNQKMIRGKLIKNKPNQLRCRGVAGIDCGSRIHGLPDVVDLDWSAVAHYVPYYQQQQPAAA